MKGIDEWKMGNETWTPLFKVDRSCIGRDGSRFSTTHDGKRLPFWRRLRVAIGYGWRGFWDAWKWTP